MALTSIIDSAQTLTQVGNSVVGGDIINVLLRQSSRLRSVLGSIRFKATQVAAASQNITYTAPLVFLAGVPITVKSQESYTYASDITQFPVEYGANLTDHVILQPVRVSVSAEVSNWEDGRAEQSMGLLEDMWRLRLPVELQTRHKVLKDMVLVNFQADNSVPNWGALSFRATFQSISLVTLRTEQYPTEKVIATDKTSGSPVQKSVETPTDSGKQKPQSSTLNDLFGK